MKWGMVNIFVNCLCLVPIGDTLHLGHQIWIIVTDWELLHDLAQILSQNLIVSNLFASNTMQSHYFNQKKTHPPLQMDKKWLITKAQCDRR